MFSETSYANSIVKLHDSHFLSAILEFDVVRELFPCACTFFYAVLVFQSSSYLTYM